MNEYYIKGYEQSILGAIEAISVMNSKLLLGIPDLFVFRIDSDRLNNTRFNLVTDDEHTILMDADTAKYRIVYTKKYVTIIDLETLKALFIPAPILESKNMFFDLIDFYEARVIRRIETDFETSDLKRNKISRRINSSKGHSAYKLFCKNVMKKFREENK